MVYFEPEMLAQYARAEKEEDQRLSDRWYWDKRQEDKEADLEQELESEQAEAEQRLIIEEAEAARKVTAMREQVPDTVTEPQYGGQVEHQPKMA